MFKNKTNFSAHEVDAKKQAVRALIENVLAIKQYHGSLALLLQSHFPLANNVLLTYAQVEFLGAKTTNQETLEKYWSYYSWVVRSYDPGIRFLFAGPMTLIHAVEEDVQPKREKNLQLLFVLSECNREKQAGIAIELMDMVPEFWRIIF